jgi:UDP-N-acetylglucosamine diphosphorylase / glucose-1-phosphate thymidylyltransferase / UDP-N-acetylgalactosamine diphosphorylase / glucosamine-1-phosphate N-acetyltransferase / galactosamine-1-phosphate N-acetyltransferase
MAGAALQRDRWQTALQMPVAGIITAAHLASFDEWSSTPIAQGGIPAGSIIANARFVPRLSAAAAPGAGASPNDRHDDMVDLWLAGGKAVAARTPRELRAEFFADGRLTIDEIGRSGAETTMLDGWWLEDVWDFVRLLPEQLADDIVFLQRPGFAAALAPNRFMPPPDSAIILGDHPILIAADRVSAGEVVVKGATIEPQVVFDASVGPIYVGAGSTVHSFTRLVGPCYIGRNTQILGDRVATCSIGDVCKVRGELSNTIILGHANKGHDGFVGHSYMGRWVNLGAGTITSNLKNTYGPVALWTPRGVRDTGMQFLGTLFGDHAKTAIGTRLSTGTVLGTGANVFGAAMPPKVVPPFAWGATPPHSVYALDKFLEVAERVMERREVRMTVNARRQLEAAHHARWIVESSE